MGRLTVDLAAIVKNYQQIQTLVGDNCAASAVVKANAYGCGVAPVSQILERAGADKFFVATLPEALELRTILESDAAVFMLNGFRSSDAQLYLQESITPVLSSMPEVENYAKLAAEQGRKLPAIVHIDTGMNRLGLEEKDIEILPDKLDGIDVQYIMSHFACSDEKDHSKNQQQYESFKERTQGFSGIKRSLSNSSGIFRSGDYHFDMVRPGMCLYGLNPTPEADNPMSAAVKVEVPVLQVRQAQKGEACGYGATYSFDQNTMLAVVEMGYADGYLRHLSNNGSLYWKGHECPVRGRVSMDLTIVDLSSVPENDLPSAGDMMEAIGGHQSGDDVAEACGTIGYEIFTSLSRRYERVYKD